MRSVPVRVDFAGGWLDVPKFARNHTFIVNCTIQPLVSAEFWAYHKNSGLGGSAAWKVLNGENAFESEEKLGVGWQDPAVITETGLCVWRSGPKPILECKVNPDFLNGRLALYWTGVSHNTPGLVDNNRDYDLIQEAGQIGYHGVNDKNLWELAEAINLSYKVQLKEGMEELPVIQNSLAKKYLGGGFGGFGLYLFYNPENREKAALTHTLTIVEPYMREFFV